MIKRIFLVTLVSLMVLAFGSMLWAAAPDPAAKSNITKIDKAGSVDKQTNKAVVKKPAAKSKVAKAKKDPAKTAAKKAKKPGAIAKAKAAVAKKIASLKKKISQGENRLAKWKARITKLEAAKASPAPK